MADDRPDLNESAATPDEGDDDFAWAPLEDRHALRRALPPITPELEAENIDGIRTKVQQALDDPRPALTIEDVDAHMERIHRELEAKYGR